jgi:hypothetical protein
MSLNLETQQRLVDLLDELEDPNCERYRTLAFVIDNLVERYKSPFYDGGGCNYPNVQELVLLHLCVRLGAAIKIMEIEKGAEVGLEEREASEGFDEELSLAANHWEGGGILPKDALNEGIWWTEIMPRMTAAGYIAVHY